MQQETRRLGKLIAKCAVLAFLIGIFLWSVSPQPPFPTHWPWQHARDVSTRPGVDERFLTHYALLPLERAPSWFQEDMQVITKAINIWEAPAEAPQWGKDIGGCRANRHLETVLSNFQADLNTRPMPNDLRARQHQLRKSLEEMEAGAHVRDELCSQLDQNVAVGMDALLSIDHGTELVEIGYTRLRLACLSFAEMLPPDD